MDVTSFLISWELVSRELVPTIRIKGVINSGVTSFVIPDQIEAGTYDCWSGDPWEHRCPQRDSKLMEPLSMKMKSMGIQIEEGDTDSCECRLKRCDKGDNFKTMPYLDFPLTFSLRL